MRNHPASWFKPRFLWEKGIRATLVFICLGSMFVPVDLQAKENVPPETFEAKGNTLTTSQHVSLSADYLSYQEIPGTIYARGEVRLWYADMTLTAEEADADIAQQKVQARGEVVLVESGREIHCVRLDYDLRDGSAYARGIRFAARPWYYQGQAVEKQGDKRVLIEQPLFTTCNARHPHYHLTAGRIDIELEKSLTAYNAVFYIGTTPLFYLPWFFRSLRDSRPPFSVQVGYNDYEGINAEVLWNYYLGDENYGSLTFNLMERKGLGLGLDQHFQYTGYGSGEGDFSVFYVKDEEFGRERWTAKLENRYEITARDLLQFNVDYLSDRDFNRQFSTFLVDSYQQKSYLAYSRRGEGYYLGAGIQDVETLDPQRNIYLPSLRELPNVNFSLSSRKIFETFSPVYLSLNSAWRRYYQRVEEGQNLSFRYRDVLHLTPIFTQTYSFPVRVLTQPSISGSLGLPMTGNHKETLIPAYGEDAAAPQTCLDAAYTTQVTLTNKWVNYQRTTPTHLMQSRFTHEFSRKILLLQEMYLPRAGVDSHRLKLGLDYYQGNVFSTQTQTGYDLLDETAGWQARMDPLTFNGRTSLLKPLSLSWQGTYGWEKARITSGYLSTGTYGKKWNLTLAGSYSWRENFNPEHAIYGTLGGTYNSGIGLSVRSSIQYDFSGRRLNNFTLGLGRDLHCWNMQAAFTVYEDGKTNIGLGINLKAFPQVKAGMGGTDGFSVGE